MYEWNTVLYFPNNSTTRAEMNSIYWYLDILLNFHPNNYMPYN